MPDGTQPDLATRINRQTRTYLEQLSECVSLLDELVAHRAADRSIEPLVSQIDHLESKCDLSQRRLSRLIITTDDADLGLRLGRIYLNSPYLVELYQELDEIANLAERIATELHVTERAITGTTVEQFRDFTDWATQAMDALEVAITQFTRLLCSTTETGTIAEQIRTVQTAEGACDEIRDDIIETAFKTETVQYPLLTRDIAHLFDKLVDTMEDVTDRLVVLSSTESWIETEPPIDSATGD